MSKRTTNSDFSGRHGREQFFIEKEGVVARRQVRALPRAARRSPVIPIAIGSAVTGVVAIIAVLAVGGMGRGDDRQPGGAASLPTATPIPSTQTPLPAPTDAQAVVPPSEATPTFTPVPPTPTFTPVPPTPPFTPVPTPLVVVVTATPEPTLIPTLTPIPTSTSRPTPSPEPTPGFLDKLIV